MPQRLELREDPLAQLHATVVECDGNPHDQIVTLPL
jgi:hypothetical protein